MWGDRTPVPLNSASNNSTRLETRVTESIACGPAFAHDKADCGGMFLLSKYAIPAMIKTAKRGAIVNISLISALRPRGLK
jgi:NAD(P)-dependent dehydrogenase (short-subunit alcohol dehydrogenase family)